MRVHRYPSRRGTFRTLASMVIAVGLAACGGSSQTSAEPAVNSGGGTSSPSPISQPQNTEGRLLASNCFQCHGTLGTGGFDSIRGQEASEVLEFMNKNASSDIMAAHAQGYTPAQLQKIIAYLQQ